jgi:hypothetical protein
MACLSRIRTISIAFVLCAFPAIAANPDPDLDCAALISAASHLSVRGQLDPDPEFDRQALGGSMTYLAAYAIPKRIREAEAFKALNARRAELIASRSPSVIGVEAMACLARSPVQQ